MCSHCAKESLTRLLVACRESGDDVSTIRRTHERPYDSSRETPHIHNTRPSVRSGTQSVRNTTSDFAHVVANTCSRETDMCASVFVLVGLGARPCVWVSVSQARAWSECLTHCAYQFNWEQLTEYAHAHHTKEYFSEKSIHFGFRTWQKHQQQQQRKWNGHHQQQCCLCHTFFLWIPVREKMKHVNVLLNWNDCKFAANTCRWIWHLSELVPNEFYARRIDCMEWKENDIFIN